MTRLTNQLQHATSTYLLQHQFSPVAWQPWSEETLALAQSLDKPILLSIGYSASHWCHLMLRESFSDPEIASLMNTMFINIKVDREERPDIDEIYQAAHQFFTNKPGGWPLTVFLCPRTRLPFLVGTYFNVEANNGQLGFKDLLIKVDDYYRSRGKDFADTLKDVRAHFKQLYSSETTQDVEVNMSGIPVLKAAGDLLKDADLMQGGFGGAPKFAMPANLERLFVTLFTKSPMRDACAVHLHNTLLIMARSGINDQVGGGFFRYARDAQWMIPHYEKMLYDNGLLLAIYSQAFTVFHEANLEIAANSIAQWALTEMRDEHGAFYGSLDADSDDTEGAYYLWSTDELSDLLDATQRGVLYSAFELDKYANFGSHWHLHRERDWVSIAEELELEEDAVKSQFYSALEKLRQARLKRNKPAHDNKILTGWNGLMIRGLAMAGRTFRSPEYIQAAQKAVDFIRENLWVNNRLFATWQDGKPKHYGYLSDHVYLLDGLLELLRSHWRDEDYQLAVSLAEALIDDFSDDEGGGFYFSSHDGEPLIARPKTYADNVFPSGNGVAAKVLLRLGYLSAEPHYIEAARRTLLSGWGAMLKTPKAHHTILLALSEYLHPTPQILLKGGEDLRRWQQSIYQVYGEQVSCFYIPDSSDVHPPELLMLDDNQGLICLGDHCFETHNSLDALLEQLRDVITGKVVADMGG
ncbi:thioredoxin domain-containing protein [Aurantivibrio plasticivorans]